MKVWLVFGGEYEQWMFCGAFSSLEKAQRYAEAMKSSGYYVYSEEGELVDDPEREL